MTNNRFLRSTALLLGVLALSLIVGCNGSADQDPGTGGGTEGGGASAEEKVLHLPMRTDGPKSLDPVRGSTVYDNRASSFVYETLIQYAYFKRPSDATALEPLLLAEMPTVSEDGLTYNFKLKPGVFFHDDPCFPDSKGREMKAEDVIYSWKRMADNDNDPKSWWLMENTIAGFDKYREEQNAAEKFDYDATVEGMKVINDYEFEITLQEPVYRFLYTLAMFQLAVVPREAVEMYGSKFDLHPVGTGPFTLKEEDWVQGKSMVFNKNPNYHECYYPTEFTPEDIEKGFDKDQGKRLPLVDQVEVTMFVEDQPMWLSFSAKDVDYTQVPAENFDDAFTKRGRRSNRTFELKSDYESEDISWASVPLLDFIFYGFNMDDSLIGGYDEKSKKLRQALCLAMDWDERNDRFYNGINIIYDGPIPPGLAGHPEGHNAPESYRGPDIPRAKKLLAEAGYPDGEGLPVIEFYTSRGGNNAEQVEMLARHMEQIGVKLDIKLVDFSTLIENVNTKKAPFFSFAWSSDYPDAENNLALFYGPYESPGANHFNYKRDDYDQMYEKIRTMPPSPERLKIVESMRSMLLEDAPYAGSMARTRFYLINPRLKNFKPSEDFYNWVKYLNVGE